MPAVFYLPCSCTSEQCQACIRLSVIRAVDCTELTINVSVSTSLRQSYKERKLIKTGKLPLRCGAALLDFLVLIKYGGGYPMSCPACFVRAPLSFRRHRSPAVRHEQKTFFFSVSSPSAASRRAGLTQR